MWIPGRLKFCWGNKIIGQLASGQKKNTNVDWDTFYQGLISQQEGGRGLCDTELGMRAQRMCVSGRTVWPGRWAQGELQERENNKIAPIDLWEGRLLLKLSRSALSAPGFVRRKKAIPFTNLYCWGF